MDDLVALVRLRNLLIHRYWQVDDAKIYESSRRDSSCVLNFIERVTGSV